MVDENPRRGFDKTRKSEANTAGFEIAVEDRNPKGYKRNEMSLLSNPSLSLKRKGSPLGALFVLMLNGMRTLGEGSINCARA
jgi:hypothetical protein